MYVNYGDKNFFEHGILVEAEHSEHEFDMLVCEPYADEEDLYVFARICVDIDDAWIDREAVLSFIGMTKKTFDPVLYAVGCCEYYGPEEFGADSYGVYYDWRHMTREEIRRELRNYLIAWDNLEA